MLALETFKDATASIHCNVNAQVKNKNIKQERVNHP